MMKQGNHEILFQSSQHLNFHKTFLNGFTVWDVVCVFKFHYQHDNVCVTGLNWQRAQSGTMILLDVSVASTAPMISVWVSSQKMVRNDQISWQQMDLIYPSCMDWWIHIADWEIHCLYTGKSLYTLIFWCVFLWSCSYKRFWEKWVLQKSGLCLF